MRPAQHFNATANLGSLGTTDGGDTIDGRVGAEREALATTGGGDTAGCIPATILEGINPADSGVVTTGEGAGGGVT